MADTVITREDVQKMVEDIVGKAAAEMRKLQEELSAKQSAAAAAAAAAAAGATKTTPAEREKGLTAARYIRALAAGRGDPERAMRVAKAWGDEALCKALETSTASGGGILIPDTMVADVIGLLTSQSVVRALGAESVPMDNGSLSMPYLATGTTASYVGEGKNIGKSEPTFGMMNLSAKKLAALVPISNDMLRVASAKADTVVRNDLVRALKLREDLAFLRDDGTDNKPKGMYHWARQYASANVFDITHAGAAATLSEVTADLCKAAEKLESADVPMMKPGWVMPARIKWFLMKLRDGNGNLVFEPEMRQGTLLSWPFKITNQLPRNLGTAGDETEIYLADFDSLIIGEQTQLEISVFEGGTYHDGTQLVSGISTDQTVMRAIAKHDFGCRYRGKEVAVINACDWA
jgi:HK97 family phage major capsid protein